MDGTKLIDSILKVLSEERKNLTLINNMTKQKTYTKIFRVNKKLADYIRKQKSSTQSENTWFVKLVEREIRMEKENLSIEFKEEIKNNLHN